MVGGSLIEWLDGRREMTDARRDATSQASSVSTSSSRLANVRYMVSGFWQSQTHA